MFRATLSDTTLFTDSISTISELIDEGVFKISKDGISFIAADRAMVAVVDFKFLATAFEEFEVDQEYMIGLNIPNLLSVLRRAGAGDKISLNLKEGKLEIIIEGKSKRRFLIPLLDITQEEIPQIDQLEFSSKAEVSSEIIKNGIEDAEIVSDCVLIEGSPSKFGMKAEGDISSSQLELEKGSNELIELKCSTETKARYPIDYLKKMIKGTKLADSVVIEWGEDYPMKMTFKVIDKLVLSIVLAPRVIEE
ncbi:MAG: proliferating cell nuclear antigen (pcna) [Candidatus Aenigmatarchaeota archaeon]